MKLQNLRDVVAIAEQGSLRGAARRLGTVQPTLTRSLSELERELGAPLFERRSKGMMVTPLGQAFVRRATAILNDVRRAQEEFEQLRGNAVGLVTIGLSIAAHLQLLPKTLQQFRQRYPKVRLRIIEGFYPTLESKPEGGRRRLLHWSRSGADLTARSSKAGPVQRGACSVVSRQASARECNLP